MHSKRNATRRLNAIGNHLQTSDAPTGLNTAYTAASRAGTKSPDDIVIVKAVRTPVGKAKRGVFKTLSPEKLLIPVLKNLIETTPQLNPAQLGDVVIGTVLPPGAQGATEVRIATLLAGIPESVPCTTVNRQCSSGLQAIANVAGAIKAGYYDIAIAGGVESMSSNSMDRWDGGVNEDALQHSSAKGCYMGMGQTSENVAERFKISREKQDAFAELSHRRAAEAIKAGKFRDEIVPLTITVEDEKTKENKIITVSQDEGVRADTTAEKLAKLRPRSRRADRPPPATRARSLTEPPLPSSPAGPSPKSSASPSSASSAASLPSVSNPRLWESDRPLPFPRRSNSLVSSSRTSTCTRSTRPSRRRPSTASRSSDSPRRR